MFSKKLIPILLPVRLAINVFMPFFVILACLSNTTKLIATKSMPAAAAQPAPTQSTAMAQGNTPILLTPQQYQATLTQRLTGRIKTWGTWIQDHLRSDQIPRSIQFGLVFLLGILMSLTPCIYPVIPLTVGALQTQRSTSLGFSFLLACCYAIGLSTTFAVMGLIAASSGQLFGSFAQHPLFVLIIILQLAYMAGSMFGWYEIYIPRFMQARAHTVKAGSLLSALTFGVISGTVASPCLSPGLALLLTIVATLGNKLLGLCLLLIFGLGLSTPLILIGTFANSLNRLPRAGSWMLEIKRWFGFMLIGMCLFFLAKLIPGFLVLWLSTVITTSSAYYYYRQHQYVALLSLLLLTGLNLLFAVQATQQYLKTDVTNTAAHHLTVTNPTPTSLADYQHYQQQACQQNKPLLLAFGATWCSICHALEQQLLHNPIYQPLLDRFIVLQIDATDLQAEPYRTLQAQYQILGVPTWLIIDPMTQTVLKRFGGELYGLDQTAIYEKFKVC